MSFYFRRQSDWLIIFLLLSSSPDLKAAQIKVAVASNFKSTMSLLVEQYEAISGHDVVLISGSTGKHYAQIKNGAPYDVFFAADEQSPKLLEQQGLATPGSRFTYALGKLVLWSKLPCHIDQYGKVLEQGDFTYLAIANPKLAPYGKAAKQVLEVRDLWQSISNRLVRGENIAQAYQFVESGNAQLGFVAYSQVLQNHKLAEPSYWIVPQALYDPIKQQAVLLNDELAAADFLQFIKSRQARKIIKNSGYDVL